MKNTVAALIAAVSLTAFASQAQAEQVYNPYIGINYNYSDANAKGLRPYYNSGSVNLGTSYNRYFGTELFYQFSDQYGKSGASEKFSNGFQAYGLDLMGYLPLGCYDVWSLIGTVGIGEYKFRNKYIAAGEGKHKYRDSGYGYRAGLGIQYNIDSNWSIRTLARYVGFDKVDGYDHMMEYSAGIKYNF